jgi:Lon protease-like protein
MYLPSVIPIFALPNVVLFPGVPMPLHIFEPRYRDMVRDAAAGHEIIGMALLRGDWQRSYEARPPIFDIGCAGKLVNVEPLPDGRSNILLHGMREFTVRRHIFEKSYREAEVSWHPVGQDALGETQRAAVIRTLRRFLRATPSSPADRLLRDRSLSDAMLVNFFSYVLEVQPIEKQGLLEAGSLLARAQRLHEIVEFHLEEARLTLGTSGSDRCH